jgi:hypothetical protein
VLLEPVPRGQTYVRQLSIERLVNRAGVPQAGGKLDSHELVLSSEAMARIARVELHSIQIPQGCAIAVFSQSPGRGLSNLVDAWRARGLNVTCAGLEGMEPFLRPSFMNHEGSGDATPVLSWLRRAVPAKARLAFHTLETQTASRPVPPECCGFNRHGHGDRQQQRRSALWPWAAGGRAGAAPCE